MGAPVSARKRAVVGATNCEFFNLPAGTTVMMEPGAGGTMTAQVRIHPDSALVDADSAVASYAANATFVLIGPVAVLRGVGLVADGHMSIAFQ